MPFMYGDAVREGTDYDILLHGEQFNYKLFGPPKDAVMLRDHMIGLQVSSLVKDGGTLQVGIGALGDAIAAGLAMRQNHNDVYNKVLDETGLYFQCRTHGALFRLSDGLCIAGPCNGKPLRPVSIRESCGFIHFLGPGEMP